METSKNSIPGVKAVKYQGVNTQLIDGKEVEEINEFSCWEGTINLPCWEGYQCRVSPDQDDDYGLIRSEVSNPIDAVSDGIFDLGINTEDTNIISEGQERAYWFLVKNQQVIHDKMIHAIYNHYQEVATWFDEKDRDTYCPPLKSPKDLINLIELDAAYIHNVEKDGYAYIGFAFNCSWDEEHGMGIMTYKDQIIGEIGLVETAFDSLFPFFD